MYDAPAPKGLRERLAQLLGNNYAVVVSTADRALLVFLATFLASWTGLAGWHAALLGAIAAGVAVVQAALTAAITGNPALASFTSATLRARRDNGARALHYVPVRKPRRGQLVSRHRA